MALATILQNLTTRDYSRKELAVGGVSVILVAPALYSAARKTSTFILSLSSSKRHSQIDGYNEQFKGSVTTEQRNANYVNIVSSYYDLATEFFEWGWGGSFHFADRRKGETFKTSILRHQYYLAGRLGVKKGDTILDCGCGVGEPARNIARFTGANVKAITINKFQVNRSNAISRDEGILDQVETRHGDFCQMPYPDNIFAGAFAIEATCHAPDRTKVYGEVFRVLKPGATFACYDWCLTDLYDETNPVHRQLKHDIMEGDGLPDLVHTSVCDDAMKKVGFELVETRDCATDGFLSGGQPWYLPLAPGWNPFVWPRFQFNPIMSRIMPLIFRFLELIRVVPKGTLKTQLMLVHAAKGCVAGGVSGTFTPMYLLVARKPL
eukprot:TRINITY_DN2630_c0_g1_i6.p1 TRINITY_DN2630_c0_g1~~TRINITY_DN2630_c0_g1_i6.p1  ORF type:complete len:379 (-),score=49.12 TRINITY_DN2630_c0_g1_i6:46-1182(-)